MTNSPTAEMVLARRVFAAHRKWERGGDFWDDMWKALDNGVFDNEPVIQVALAAIRETTELAAKLVDVISSIHVEKRDDMLNIGNHEGALTQARNSQTADHIATALRNQDHLQENSHDQD